MVKDLSRSCHDTLRSWKILKDSVSIKIFQQLEGSGNFKSLDWHVIILWVNYLYILKLLGELLSKNNHIETIPSLSRAWYVSFEINPVATVDGWTNVVHFTTGSDFDVHGSRIPAVFIHTRSTRLHVCSSISGNKNSCFDSDPLHMNKFTRVEISQVQTSSTVVNSLLFSIKLDGIQVFQQQNTDARYFSNVKVYKADTYYNPTKAFIKNLIYGNLPSGKFFEYFTFRTAASLHWITYQSFYF